MFSTKITRAARSFTPRSYLSAPRIQLNQSCIATNAASLNPLPCQSGLLSKAALKRGYSSAVRQGVVDKKQLEDKIYEEERFFSSTVESVSVTLNKFASNNLWPIKEDMTAAENALYTQAQEAVSQKKLLSRFACAENADKMVFSPEAIFKDIKSLLDNDNLVNALKITQSPGCNYNSAYEQVKDELKVAEESFNKIGGMHISASPNVAR